MPKERIPYISPSFRDRLKAGIARDGRMWARGFARRECVACGKSFQTRRASQLCSDCGKAVGSSVAAFIRELRERRRN